MNLYEGIIVFNLVILLWVTYQIGRIKTDIETVYEALAMTMNAVGVDEDT